MMRVPREEVAARFGLTYDFVVALGHSGELPVDQRGMVDFDRFLDLLDQVPTSHAMLADGDNPEIELPDDLPVVRVGESEGTRMDALQEQERSAS